MRMRKVRLKPLSDMISFFLLFSYQIFNPIENEIESDHFKNKKNSVSSNVFETELVHIP